MGQNLQNIIFDFGGVLLDWQPDRVYSSYFASEAAMRQFYEETEIMLHNRELDRGQPFDKLLKALAQRYPHYREPLMLWRNAWHKMLGGRIEGSVEILHELHQLGYPLYGLTNWAAETFPFVFYSHDFFQLFQDIVVSGREGWIKPEREIFAICLSRNQLQAKDCIFIDDNRENVAVAESLGIIGVPFTDPEQLRKTLQELGIPLKA